MTLVSEEAWRPFVQEGTRTAAVATVRADGRPHVAPAWFLLGANPIFSTAGRDPVKGRTLLRTGRIAPCIQGQTPPFACVAIEGTARLVEQPSDMLCWTTRIAARFMGAEQVGPAAGATPFPARASCA